MELCEQSASSEKKTMKRGIWSEDEHERFLVAIELYPRGPWRFVAKYVGTRSCRQVLTHAQKYFEKVGRYQRGIQRERKGHFRPEHRISHLSGQDISAAQPGFMQDDTYLPCHLGPASMSAVEVSPGALSVESEASFMTDPTPVDMQKERSESIDSILCSAELPSLEEALSVLMECLSEDESSYA